MLEILFNCKMVAIIFLGGIETGGRVSIHHVGVADSPKVEPSEHGRDECCPYAD